MRIVNALQLHIYFAAVAARLGTLTNWAAPPFFLRTKTRASTHICAFDGLGTPLELEGSKDAVAKAAVTGETHMRRERMNASPTER